MFELFAAPVLLLLGMVMIHAFFGLKIIERNIIFTDLAIAQFAALGVALSLGLFHFTSHSGAALFFALLCALIIAYAHAKNIAMEPFIGLLYVLSSSGAILVLANSAEGLSHFKSLLAGDILFVTWSETLNALLLYTFIALVYTALYKRVQGFYKELLFFASLAVTVTSSVQLVGVLVVFTLLVAPTFAARSQRHLTPYVFSILYGWCFCTLSLFISFYTDLPTGYTMVFTGALGTLTIVLIPNRNTE